MVSVINQDNLNSYHDCPADGEILELINIVLKLFISYYIHFIVVKKLILMKKVLEIGPVMLS